MKMNNTLSSCIVVFLLLLALVNYSHSSRSFIFQSSSDGVHEHIYQPLSGSVSASCKIYYGFLPCANNLAGYIFQIVLYEYLLFLGSNYVSAGSELIFEIMGPSVFGGSVFRILCAIPKSLILLASVLAQSKDEAQSNVMVGMGMLAGSTIFLLTVLWGSCVAVGKCDLDNSNAKCPQHTKGFDLLGSGIMIDDSSKYAARVMAASIIPYIFAQMCFFSQPSSGRSPAILVSLITCILLLVSDAVYQGFHPSIQRRTLEFVRLKHVISGILEHFETHSPGSFLKEDGEVNTEVLEKLFRAMDLNGDGYLSSSELRALIIGIRFEKVNFDHDDLAQHLLTEFDTSGDSQVDEDEFVKGISKWVNEAKRFIKIREPCSSTTKFIHDYHQRTKEEHDMLLGDDEKKDGGDGVENRKPGVIRATLTLVFGVAIATVFAGPLTEAVNDFSIATSIPSFVTSFIALPVATNLRGAVLGLTVVSKKKRRNTSLALSEIYGSVFMSNTLGLGVFLALVYIHGLKWEFSAEVWVVIAICSIMGLLTSFRNTFPLWTSIVAYLLYPISLLLVYAQRN